jgi:4-amino-4-deoxy-L-arabinose transferase-like glycosyltransferase
MIKQTDSPKRTTTIALLLILMLIGLALRLWFVSVNELDPTNSPADDGDYYQRALDFATTGQYIDDFWLIRPPLHVFLFALMLKISIVVGNVPGLALVRAAQITLSLLSIPIGYSLSRRLFGHRAGLVFGGLLAVWYPLIELPAHLFTEPLFIFLLLTHMWLLVWWRDTRRWYLLAGSGVALGLTALTRSVAVYGVPFVIAYLVIEKLLDMREQSTDTPPLSLASLRINQVRIHYLHHLHHLAPYIAPFARTVGRWSAIFLVSFALVVIPWSVRNYMVYERFILIDTIGSVNLWLHMEKYEEKGVEIIKTMPQRDRHVFAVEDTKRMFFDNPVHFWKMLWRNAWLHFLHIWKAQFVEDFLLKSSFYGRPLRAMWLPGLVGDALWFGFTLTGLVALVAPLREGAFRVMALGWTAYTILTVMLFHLEPRYLMPLWLMLMLYGSWALGSPRGMLALLLRQRLAGVLALVVGGAFVVLCLSYRDYPATLAAGFEREWHRAAGVRAYTAGDNEQAVRELRAALEAQPGFVSSQAELALALVAQRRYDEARELTGTDDAQHMLVARGAIALAHDEPDKAAELLTKAEKKAGEDVQRITLEWLHTAPRSFLELGSGHDFGYIHGFSLPESTGPPNHMSYRWLQGQGRVVLPLTEPLRAGRVLYLRMAGGQVGATPLRVSFDDAEGTRVYESSLQVQAGRWRVYRLVVPQVLEGQRVLDVQFDAPIFIPAHVHAETNDIRPVSLMVNAVWVP